MTGNSKGWTFDTLLAHLEGQIKAVESAADNRFLGQGEALAKAETASEKRFDSVNEFRGTLSDQARQQMPRGEAEQAIKANSDKTDVLAIRLERIEGRGAGLSAGWAIVLGVAGLVSMMASVAMGLLHLK